MKEDNIFLKILWFSMIMLFFAYHYVLCATTFLGLTNHEYYHGRRIKWGLHPKIVDKWPKS